MDDLSWLRLQVEWGADEALEDRPVDRRGRPALPAATITPAAANPAAGAPTPAAPPQPAGPAGVAQARALAAAAATPAELRAALAGFNGCALRATATSLVFSNGDPAAQVVLVADVPGAAEDRAGLPFAGANGLFLDRMFASAGLDRAACLATSLLPWRPPGDRKPTDGEVQLCLPFLLRHLELLQPRRVLLFGSLAARVLLPATGRRARGVWHAMTLPGAAQPLATLALPAIAHIQASASAKRETWADMLRLRRAMDDDRMEHG